MSAPRPSLHVEELELHGFSSEASLRVLDALRHELAALLARSGAARLLARRLQAVRIDSALSTPSQIGREAARAIYAELCRDAESKVPS